MSNRRVVPLDAGWELAATAPDAVAVPAELANTGGWIKAAVPGTAAQALRDAGQWALTAPTPLHDRDFWYRTRFSGEGARTLRLHGLATLAEVWLNGERLLRSDNMFLAHEVDARLRG
ncbi:MAG TPA: glycoside hydrolase family 2 protein, partial [Vineibacter sp.]|nr:glycoside hydrolase family 2 protein [Vineibacter sp.]